MTLRLVLTYFNWIWRRLRFQNTAAQRAELTKHRLSHLSHTLLGHNQLIIAGQSYFIVNILELVLDWCHIGKKLQNVSNLLGQTFTESLDSAKWSLWHGKAFEVLDDRYRHMDKHLGHTELIKFVESSTNARIVEMF